jgi:hypothetical protein
MYKVIDTIVNVGCLLAAGFYLLTILWAQLNCSMVQAFGRQCRDPELDIWTIPFALAPIGIPALIGAAQMLWGARRR